MPRTLLQRARGAITGSGDEPQFRLGFIRVALFAFSLSLLAFALVPLVYIGIWAFWGTETVGILDAHPSLSWFSMVYTSPQWIESFIYSLVLSSVSSLFGLIVLGTYFYFCRFSSPLIEYPTFALVLFTLIVPSVIFALALRLIGLNASEPVLVFAGTFITMLPIQYLVLDSAQNSLPSEPLFAGVTLGASHFRNIWSVYVPMQRRPLIEAGTIGFFFCFDELVISTFVIDSPFVTIPRRMWDQVNQSMDPIPAVITVSILGLYATMWFAPGVVRKIAKH